MSKIITFGDSHSMNGWPDYVIQNHLGPIMADFFGKEKLNCLDISNYDINEGDHLIFCFGEIDCRCYISRMRHIDYVLLIENIVNEYVDAIEQNINKLNKNVNIWLFNAVPTSRIGDFEQHPLHPTLGSNNQRMEYTKIFNMFLSNITKIKKWGYFDVYDKYVDEHGFMEPKLSDFHCHIGNGIYVEEFIKQNILINL